MKDVAHHLRYIQKKNIQDARKEINGHSETNGTQLFTKEAVNRRRRKFNPETKAPRILKRIGVV